MLTLFLAASVLACTAQMQPPSTTTTGSASGLLPSDPPLAASRPVLPAMPADCHSSPELAPTWRAPQPSTVPIATVLERARQDAGGVRGTGRWFEKVPADSTLVTLRDGRAMWMIGYAEPPPFPQFGPRPMFGRRSQWTAWIALFDATTGDFVTALSCGGVSASLTQSPSPVPQLGQCERIQQTRLAGQPAELVAVFESTALEVAAWQESGLVPGGGRAGQGMSPLRSRQSTEVITSCYFDGTITLRMPVPQGGVPPVFERVLFVIDASGMELQVSGGTKSVVALIRPSAP